MFIETLVYIIQLQRYQPKKIKIWVIANFTFFDPKKKLFKVHVELCQFNPRMHQKLAKNCLKIVFYAFSFVLSRRDVVFIQTTPR